MLKLASKGDSVTLRDITRALLASGVVALVPVAAYATPTTTYWAPSAASCQARGVPHVTYDTYFWKGPAAGSQGAPGYPMDRAAGYRHPTGPLMRSGVSQRGV